MKSICKLLIYATVMAAFAPGNAVGQLSDTAVHEQLAVTARPSRDSITLRWAPRTFAAWQLGNAHGYRIERYVMVRAGRVLSSPEKQVLDSGARPLPESAWESRVGHNKYAAIAAQALYGDAFHVDLGQHDIFSIVNKVEENQQRFSFALFAADMSPAVARASGLWYTDKAVRPGERYLYRVIVNSADTLRGSVFIAAEDPGPLPAPQHLQADFKAQLVSLKWESQNNYYSAYTVERATDGKTFFPLSDTPLVTVSPTDETDSRYQYAVDSLSDLSRVYHYRVVGITPFGEKSPPSTVVRGKGALQVSQVPYITAVNNINNTALEIVWEFPARDNEAINGFRIERASDPKGEFLRVAPGMIESTARTWTDKMPRQVNYYRIEAFGRDGRGHRSPVYFAQLVDSIPPAAPAGLRATVDDSGRVLLRWGANTDHDLFGYRVYKGHHQNEEPAQITTGPIPDTTFVDHVDLHTLNDHVYYRVMAIDINQNHSALSPPLAVSLPDKVKPQPPVLLPVLRDGRDAALRWISSASADVRSYAIYRSAGTAGWILLHTEGAHADSVYTFRDATASAGARYHYTVVAVDDAGLESAPADPVTINTPGDLYPAVAWRKPTLNREENRLTLRWIYEQQQAIESFRLYAAVNNDPPVLYKTLQPDKVVFSDVLVPGRKYTYRIVAQFENGRKSHVSEPLVVEY